MDEELGMMAQPADMDMGMEEPMEPTLLPEEVDEIQAMVDSSPALAKFIDMIAKEDPMEYGISTGGGGETPLAVGMEDAGGMAPPPAAMPPMM
jgi:hypothetical protein